MQIVKMSPPFIMGQKHARVNLVRMEKNGMENRVFYPAKQMRSVTKTAEQVITVIMHFQDDAIQATINWTHYDGYGREVTGTKTFYGTPNLEMTWWSANRFCEAIGGRVAGSNDMHCMDGLGRWGYCHYKAIGSNAYVKDNISKIVTGLWEAFGKVGDDFYWLDKVYASCEVYQVGLEFGNIDGTYTTNSYPALCVID